MSDTAISKQDKASLKKLSLPNTRFVSDYAVAQQIVNNAVSSHSDYWDIIKACEKHIDGEKPVPPEELKKKGMAWASNFNFHKARGKIEKGVGEACAKISSALALSYVTFRNTEDADEKDKVLSFLLDSNKRGIVSSVIGYALSSTLAKETRLSGWLNEVEYPSYAFGYCALSYDPYDWMPQPTHPLNIAFKPYTKPDDIREWVVFRRMDASELYDRWIEAYNESIVISDEDCGKPKKITSSGWNLAALEEVLLCAYNGKINVNDTPNSWAQVVSIYEENPSMVMMQTDSIMIAKIFYREQNGNISETYI